MNKSDKTYTALVLILLLVVLLMAAWVEPCPEGSCATERHYFR
jgi:hypothetical protein